MPRSAIVEIVAALWLAASACSGDSQPPPTTSPSPTTLAPTPASTRPPVTLAPDQTYTTWRWGNITVSLPDRDDIFHIPDHLSYQATDTDPRYVGYVLEVRGSAGPGTESEIHIDADNGDILLSEISDDYRDIFSDIEASIRVEPSPSPEVRGWPYVDTEPSGRQFHEGRLRYWEPGPSTGLLAYPMCYDASFQASAPIEECWLLLTGTSVRATKLTGEIITESVSPEDKEAFDRWFASVEILPADQPTR